MYISLLLVQKFSNAFHSQQCAVKLSFDEASPDMYVHSPGGNYIDSR